MIVKFKPTQIAMSLSANYARWYAKMVPTATVTSAPTRQHTTTRESVLLHCYIVTCYIKVVFTMLAVFGNR